MHQPDGKLEGMSPEEFKKAIGLHPARPRYEIGEIVKLKGREYKVAGIRPDQLVLRPMPYTEP